VLTFAARKTGNRSFKLTQKIFKINVAEVKKVRTFAVPKQGALNSEREGSDFRII